MFSSTFTVLTVSVACWCPLGLKFHRHHHVQPVPVEVCPAPAVIVPHAAEPVKEAPKKIEPTKEMPKVEPKKVEPKKVEAPKVKSLYERLGGEPAVKAVVDDFVGRTAANPKVNFTRKGTPVEWKATPEAVAKLKERLVELVGAVTGGPQKYTGKSMKDAHKGMKITKEEFGAIAGDLKATLDKFKVPAKEQEELMKIVGSTAGDIIEAAPKVSDAPKAK